MEHLKDCSRIIGGEIEKSGGSLEEVWRKSGGSPQEVMSGKQPSFAHPIHRICNFVLSHSVPQTQ